MTLIRCMLGIVAALTAAIFLSCRSGPDENGDTKPDDIPELPADVRELFKVPDRGHRETSLRFLAACKAGDAPTAKGMMTEYAINEACIQHGTFEAYIASAQKILTAESEPVVKFDVPYRRRYADGKEMDKGDFYEVWVGTDHRFLFFLVDGVNNTLKIDNVLANPRTRVFVFERITPAIGMLLEDTQIAFMAYYYGAIFGEHPASVLAERKGPEATDKERLAWLRLCSTQTWIDSIKNDPDARGNVLTFLKTGKEKLSTFSEPISVVRDEYSYTFSITPIGRSQPSQMKYVFVRDHGVYRINDEERVN